MLDPFKISCIGFLAIMCLSLPFALIRFRRLLPPKGYRYLFVFRSICGTIFLICTFHSVQLIPLGDASVLFSTAPVFTYLLGSIFLKEPLTIHSAIMLFILMCGIVLVTQPVILTSKVHLSSEYFLGISFGLLASFSEAIGNIILRKLKNFHFSIIMFNYGFLSFLQVLPFLIYQPYLIVNEINYYLIVILALFTALEQLLVILALSLEKAGHVALIQASDIIYGYIFQVIFFEEAIQIIPMIGAGIVAGVIVHMAHYGRKEVHRRITV
ncbi:hypothetical protein O3M35_002034 [Rhynocoris fuscipes]|uniref:EamA domain-containing protein n=1 Tax=Rhynocoris fuscipes TaxID=488301 RepID=A0AAW1CR09_9HEMI